VQNENEIDGLNSSNTPRFSLVASANGLDPQTPQHEMILKLVYTFVTRVGKTI